MSSFQISLYRQGKTWMFDDEERGIHAEPFVCGASELIQKHLSRKGMGRRKKNVLVSFSLQPMENADIELTCTAKCYPILKTELKKRFGKFTQAHISNVGESKTNEPTSAYYVDQEGQQCWLCPAQLKFFGQVADEIYVKIL